MSDDADTPAQDVPYENTADPDWARKALDLYRQRQLQMAVFDTDGVVSAQVWGPCPRCGHDIDVQPVLTAPLADQGRGWWPSPTGQNTSGTAKVPKSIEVGCGCGRAHRTRDGSEAVLGCGVSFHLPTTPPAGASVPK